MTICTNNTVLGLLRGLLLLAGGSSGPGGMVP
jgi:hypothetical protein